MPPENLDCVIVGYNEISLSAEYRHALKMESSSAHVTSILSNTIEFKGDRISYLDYLNEVAASEIGYNPRLHVASMPNLGVNYLWSFLKSRGLSVEGINFFNYEKEALVDLISKRRVNLVAITTTFYTSDEPVRELVDFIRSQDSSIKIVVGGPFVLNAASFYKKEVLDYLLQSIGADFYIYDSQGEATLADLATALKTHRSGVASIPNLIINGSPLIRNLPAPEANDLQSNAIDWHNLPMSACVPTVMTRTARSCAFKCSFCTYPVLAGALTLMNVEEVERQLETLEAIGTRYIGFIDDTFNVPLDRFKAMCRMMIRRKFDIRWFSYLRCGNIDEEGLDLLAEAGCEGVFLGIESGDPDVLRNMNKKAVPDRYRQGIIGLRERGIVSYASIIVGFPGETADSVRRTIELIQDAKPTFFHPELYCHYQFSPVNKDAEKFELKGTGYSWSHKTMTWQDGREALLSMITGVTESIYMPTYSFDFWALPYLYGQGFTLEFIKDYLRISSQKMVEGLLKQDADVDRDAELGALVRRSWPQRSRAAAFESGAL